MEFQPCEQQTSEECDSLKQLLDSAVREYEKAITRSPTNETEISKAVDKCASARQRLIVATAKGVMGL